MNKYDDEYESDEPPPEAERPVRRPNDSFAEAVLIVLRAVLIMAAVIVSIVVVIFLALLAVCLVA